MKKKNYVCEDEEVDWLLKIFQNLKICFLNSLTSKLVFWKVETN